MTVSEQLAVPALIADAPLRSGCFISDVGTLSEVSPEPGAAVTTHHWNRIADTTVEVSKHRTGA